MVSTLQFGWEIKQPNIMSGDNAKLQYVFKQY